MYQNVVSIIQFRLLMGGYQAVKYNYFVPTSKHPVFHAVRLRRKRFLAPSRIVDVDLEYAQDLT